MQPRQPKPQAKPLELLRLLACSPGMGLGVATAADVLWPDADGAAAQKSLEMALLRLRRLLGDAQLLTQSEGHLQLDPQRVCSDLLLRDRITQQLVDQALAPQTHPISDLAALSTRLREWLALAAPQARLLPGVPETPWVLERREHAQRNTRRARSALRTVLARARHQGTHDIATAAAALAALADLERTLAQTFVLDDD